MPELNKPITVVTGQPRSGTTLMMRMLEAGGIEPYYDKRLPIRWIKGNKEYVNYNVILREADRTKFLSLRSGNGSWLAECEGMAVKMMNLGRLEIPDFDYRFIYMDRNIEQIARSQQKYAIMTQKTEYFEKDIIVEYLREAKSAALEKLKDYQFMVVAFETALKKPKAVAVRVADFLDMDMDIDKMAAVVVKRPAHCLPEMLEERIYND